MSCGVGGGGCCGPAECSSVEVFPCFSALERGDQASKELSNLVTVGVFLFAANMCELDFG